MSDDLLLHPKVRSNLEQVISNQPHGLLISGPDGSGKETLLRNMAAELLHISQEQIQKHPYVLIINPKDESISIDEIRGLQQFLKLKVPHKRQTLKRIIIIDQAGRMRSEAQNALLKTLEEPPADTMLLLSATHADRLLPTINSRLYEVAVLPISLRQAAEYYSTQGKSPMAITKAYALSQGHAGLLNSLLTEEEHELTESVEKAKAILGAPIQKRLLLTDELSKNKQQVNRLLQALSRITHAALYQASTKNNTLATKKWHEAEISVLKAQNSLPHNPNTKLLLDDLFLNI
ncbi:MAG: AAA family ATPase [bacterium]|nr:AAA family ATPase [bacterium]